MPRTVSHNIPESDWLRRQGRWVSIPSWVISLVLHVSLAVLILSFSQMGSCRPDFSGEGGESFREVGIHYRPATTEPPAEQETPSQEAVDSPTNPAQDASLTLDQPPIPLSLPPQTASTPLIGAGPALDLPASAAESLVKPTTSTAASPSGAPSGGASFFGVEEQVAQRIVYIIDRSYSMENQGAFQAAKSELLASLQTLEETQRFQIIFYNNDSMMLRTRDDRYDMFWGTDPQRLQVKEQLGVVRPEGGTDHLPAILAGLELKPDVIFLLTDGAEESRLKRQELNDIRRHNHRDTHIHCIEFGRAAGPLPGNHGNFLKELASENHGQYLYRQVNSSMMINPRQ